jgi:MoaA/NifB/PqqE/SkfB family radical SAM enzyme
MYPWHWMIVTDGGEVLPCGHGSRSVGNVREQTVAEVWNGVVMQELRATIQAGEVHAVCRSTDCPYQQEHLVFSPATERVELEHELAEAFDEAWYLEAHADVRVAVERRLFVSGLEHFARHGRAEGRAYQLLSRGQVVPSPSVANATLALLEYARGATQLRSNPVDLVVQVSTICNLRCVMCPHGVGSVERPQHMPIAVFERLLPFVDTAARMIVSGLGEPFLAPAFWALVERCAGRNEVFIRANSNAHFVTRANTQRVLSSGLKEISFSLDAATAGTYAKIRGSDFARVRAGVATMCAARREQPQPSLEIFINMTLMAENVAEAAAFVELAAELDVDGVLFSQLFPFGDQPDWRVERPDWRFIYSEQMLDRRPELAGTHLRAARARAEALGVKVEWQSNTHRYLSDTASVVNIS